MFTFSLFILSGAMIVIIALAKRREEKKKKSVFLLKIISIGDERIRHLRHEGLHFYSQGKEKFSFWIKKQLPLKLKSLTNRFQAYIGEKSVEYLGDVRNTRLLKRSDGISEFFKNISDIEKGNGELHDDYQRIEEDIEVTETKVVEPEATQVTATASPIEPVHVAPEIPETPTVIATIPRVKAKTTRKRTSTPRRRRVQVMEVLD
jgi:hypothetical protein